ncbi:TetR/AcrR family transcriptional regulator [Rhodococcus sp. NPDC058521]|uniref:TetR/AcrR family transcriptional regulator n=1 Tax=Rhodococcus sp. NPDC058521 TaxID=3346536 RepID=UPI00364C013E
MTPDTSRRSERARTAILLSTQELIKELPYPKITIEGIASRAGVGKQTIYRWWRSKGAVVVDALALQNSADDLLQFPDTGDLATDMRTVLRATVDEFTSPDFEPLFRALTIESMQDAELQQQVVERVYRPQLEHVDVRFRSAQEQGQIRDDIETALAFELFVAPLFHRWMNGAFELDYAHADAVVDLAMRALAP